MDKKYFADLEWSKKLGHLFPDAEWWWIDEQGKSRICNRKPMSLELQIKNYGYPINHYPTLHTDMILERLPYNLKTKFGHHNKEVRIYLKIDKHPDSRIGYRVKYVPEFNPEAKEFFNNRYTDKKLPNALCAMLEWVTKEEL